MNTDPNRLVKWKTIESSALTRVIHRLCRMAQNPPPHVPRLFNFGLLPEGRLRLDFEHVNGMTLHHAIHVMSRAERATLAQQLSEQVDDWTKCGFVHGDLSLRNILVKRGSTAWDGVFIDWIVDLKSYEGTPDFASREALTGARSVASDRYAIQRIVCILTSEFKHASRQHSPVGQTAQRLLRSLVPQIQSASRHGRG